MAGTNVLDSSNNEKCRGGYTTHDINMKYKLNSQWTLFAAVNNLTDKQYAKVNNYFYKKSSKCLQI